ncbi:MAG: IMPACT family protein [Candidatus Kapaibacterium sp.]
MTLLKSLANETISFMTNEQDFYFTVTSAYRASELKVKGSRFIADIFPAASKEDVEKHLAEIRKEFYDATHHCYAFRLGIGAENIRAADDGEPAGTAGKPILQALVSKELTDCLLIVTRYYGGVNLGTGGLSRAYSEAAQIATEGAAIQKIFITESFTLTLDYEDISSVERMLHSYEAKHSSEFAEKVIMKIEIRKSLAGKFRDELAEKYYGKVIISEG